ncbi:thermonuclease family protein [Natrinema pallidum]|uniref:Nuclease n=1 Tax=Natrinema pallidum TaxID=69527 RepID=A0A4P9TIY1_9EURY|nr:thermonuclease family protein [Natrinema pallidum]QCW04727.1 nuclease [Natrinema pallidum]
MVSFRAIGESGIDRRAFVSLLGTTTGALALSRSSDAVTTTDSASGDGLESLSFYSTASQVSAAYGPLTDEEHVVAWASENAYVTSTDDGTDDADVVSYEDARIPLITQDGTVMGIGSAGFLSDERGGFTVGNEEFVLNAWEQLLGPEGTVLWDESHEQYWDLSRHDTFRRYADDNGYELRALEEFATDGTTLQFYSTASQVAPGGDVLTEAHLTADDDLEVLAWAEPTATNGDRTGSDAVEYGDAERIPLLTRDDRVVGIGAPLVEDDSDHEENRAFVRGVWDAVIDGGTVYWDESHDQYCDTDRFETFIADAEGDGYTVTAADDLRAVLEGASDGADETTAPDADAVVITTPATAFTDAELAALESFVADGGAVLLHDQSDYGGHDETGALNEIAARLDLGFRFNADQVADDTSGWDEHVFTTAAVDETYVPNESGSVGLADADGLVITTPQSTFDESELAALESFVADGGALFLFDQSDFGGNDRTGILNEIAERLDLAFRFNGGQVEDEVRNAGPVYEPVATEFSPAFDYFDGRDGIGIEFDRHGEYYGRITRVFDGDTVEVEFDTEYGHREIVRNVGVDTAETPPTAASPREWVGIPDDATAHLHDWGERAAAFALERLAPDGAAVDEGDLEGRHVKITFDEAEPIRGNYGRLLGYLHYDPDDFTADFDAGSFAVNYNRRIVADGYARVYSSGFAAHDEFAALEENALAAGRGVWSASDVDARTAIRNEPVEDLFVPSARSIRSARGRTGGRVRDERVAVSAAASAEQHLEGDGVAYDGDVPLVGVDERRRVALVGGLLIDERYEADEGFGADTSGYGNFPFLTNLIDCLSETDGDVILAGGQGQFNAAGSLSLEDCKYYRRYLEGVDERLRQINDLERTLPDESEPPRAVLLSAPAHELAVGDCLALREYRNAGGAVVLLGSAAADADHTRHLNRLAAQLGTDLRFNTDRVVDPDRNLADDPAVLETAAFNHSFPLFDAYEPSDRTDDADEAPGNSGHARGHRGNGPGNSGQTPGHGGSPPGNSGHTPGHHGGGK